MQQLIISLIFLILSCSSGISQPYSLEKLSSWNFSENASISGIAKDSSGFLWVATNTGLFRYDGSKFDRFTKVGSSVKNLYIDKSDKIWLTSNYGLVEISAHRDSVHILKLSEQFISLKSNPFQEVYGLTKEGNIYALKEHDHLLKIPLDYSSDTIACMPFFDFEIDKENNLWLTSGRNLYAYNKSGKFLTSIQVPVYGKSFWILKNRIVFASLEQYDFVEYSLQDQSFSPYKLSDAISSISQNNHFSILIDESGNYWLTNYGDLVLLDQENSTITTLGHLFKGQGWEQSSIKSIFKVQENEFYLGSSEGLFRLKKNPGQYQTIVKEDIPALNDRNLFSIRKLYYDKGNLLIGSYAGFGKFNLSSQDYQSFFYYSPKTKKLQNPLVYDILKDGEIFFLASETVGLFQFRYEDEIITKIIPEISTSQSEKLGLAKPYYFSLLKTENKILLGSIEGLEIYEGGVFRKFSTSHEAFNNAQIFDIIDVGEYIYIGSTAGLFLLEKNDVNRIPLFLDKAAIVNYLYHHDDILWIGTRGDGLIKYNISNGEKQFFHYDQGLIDLTVNAITFGNDGGLWFSTNLGITRLDTLSHQVEHYFSKDELDWNEFNHNAMTTDDVGNIYFGGTRGIVYFNPKEMNAPENPSRLIISRITKRDGDTGEIHEEIFDRTNQQEIVLHHNDRYFSIDFTKSNLTNSRSEQFQYKLDGQEWIKLGNSRTIQFTDLNPGKYNLIIASANVGKSIIKPLSIPVIIHQVYYKQWWALLMYALIIIGTIYWIVKNILVQSKLQAGLSYQKAYNKKLEELAETKTQIFSNLAHEFQTPLTLIQGPAAKIKETIKEKNIQKWSNTILKNSSDLMEMIQQMLKLSRMDEGVYDIQWIDGEVVSFLKTISNSFEAIAHSKNISLSFLSNQEKIYCRYDEEKLSHIFKNLLSNALKFTPEGGQIKVKLDSEFLEIEDLYKLNITIADTGIGISKENLPHIFNRFYQADGTKTREVGGTGIGLSLVKEFVQLLNGQINVESHPEIGTSFILYFEFEKGEKLIETQAPGEATLSNNQNNKITRNYDFSQNKDVVLIIEDHFEVKEFIVDCLGIKYEIHEASNGIEGLKKAVELIPDLIISDVMMPHMDGYDLIEHIKKNPLTIQIPCIMLTAKNSDEDRIQSRKSGAEAFLGKPFMPEELEIVAENLLALKKNVIKENEHKSIKQVRDPFIQNLLNLVEKELNNSNLNVKLITSELAISRTQLHRKIKSLTGKSINQFVRDVRLEKAKELLQTGHFHVSEVCYKVGFTQPSYFAARYKEYFGSLPSDLIN